MVIPEAAVEAAAKVTFEGLFDLDASDGWEYLTPSEREPYEHQARAALEAAAPFIRAQALEDAADAWQVRMDTIGRGTVEAKTFMQRRAQADRSAK